jgi:hypothetical protein
MHRTRVPVRATVLATAALALALAGCTAESTATPGGQAVSRSAAAGDDLSLRGLCPDPVVIQSNWWPQAEDGALYQLVGANPTVDKDRKRVSGALVARGVDTGVHIEIRSGGPANSYTPAARVLYLDPAVLFAQADLDQVAEFRNGSQPVRAVFAPLDRSPLVLLWDPVTHPDFRTIDDIGRTDTRVVYLQGAAYMDYLVAAGKLHQSQVEAAYDGTPARFVAERGRIVQQGLLTNEVYEYQNELADWKKKVGWTLVDDAGYPNYPSALVVRPDHPATACLRRLVPILQRATVDYAGDPSRTNDLIVALVKDFGAPSYPLARAGYAVRAMLDNAILGNGTNTTLGDFDTKRVDQLVDAVRPTAARAGAPLPSGLSAKDLATNEYLDPTIALP